MKIIIFYGKYNKWLSIICWIDKVDNLFFTQAAKYVAANLDSFFLTINGSLIILMQVLSLKLWKDLFGSI